MGLGPDFETLSISAADLLQSPTIMATDAPLFHKDKHISYWLRCFRTPLPHHYTSQDANRMTLAFFTVSALDVLGVLFTHTAENERIACTEWIYRCQHPDGGFRGFPGTDFDSKRNDKNKVWDPANVPATYFALGALAILGDDLQRVKRVACLKWLNKMQRADGSFGETLGSDGHVEGGTDMRFGYTAMMTRWILRGNAIGVVEGVPDVNIAKLVECIRGSESYDGGVSEAPYHEAHAGFTYCAIGVLSLLGRLPEANTPIDTDPEGNSLSQGLSSYDKTVRWLLSRLTTAIDECDQENSGSDSDAASDADYSGVTNVSESKLEESRPAPTPGFDVPDPPWTGFNGRSNKIADTCYAWWVGGSLMMLGALSLVDYAPLRRYLTERTQHLIAGGFGKVPGAPPDVYHAYLGLAALSLLEPGTSEEEVLLGRKIEETDIDPECENDAKNNHPANRRVLRRLDPTACFSVRAKRWIESLSWRVRR